MVLEVVVPDGSPEAIILNGMADPQSYLLELVRADQANQIPTASSETPDYLAIIQRAQESPNRFQTREEIDTYLEELRNEW